MAPKIKVAIVGAGVCGIAAGKVLQNNSLFEFKIFEASDRIGGRIWTHYDKSDEGVLYKFEYGANWIHGTEGNPVQAIADNNQLYRPLCSKNDDVKNSRYKKVMRTPEGVEVSLDIHRKVFAWYRSILQAAEEIYQQNLELSDNVIQSVGAFISEKMGEKIEAVYGCDEISRDSAYGLMRNLLVIECNITGSDSMDDVSLSQFGTYRTLEGKDRMINQGYDQVVQCLARDVPESNIVLGSHVTNISYPPAQDEIKLTCENGESFDADVVIVTSSLGYLKGNYQQLFTPALSDERVCSLTKLHMGIVNKIFLHFDNLDFFPDNLSQVQVAFTEDALNCSDPGLWFRKIPAFIVESEHPSILVAWIAGSASEFMETLTDCEVIEGCMTVLRDILQDTLIPLPNKIHRSSWHSNPYTRGSYTYIPTGATVKDIDVLATPIYSPVTNKPVVMFGGEALHREFYSTVHGALLSGQRQAELVIQAYTDNNILV